MSAVQAAADKFFRRRVPDLKDNYLASGEQDEDYFKYQYMSQDAPFTLT